MRLTPDQIKEALRHPAQNVRDASVYYFANSFSTDPEIVSLAIQTIDQYGFEEAFGSYTFLQNLVQTEESVRWLIRQLQQRGKPCIEHTDWLPVDRRD